jgi:hypothetical protein
MIAARNYAIGVPPGDPNAPAHQINAVAIIYEDPAQSDVDEDYVNAVIGNNRYVGSPFEEGQPYLMTTSTSDPICPPLVGISEFEFLQEAKTLCEINNCSADINRDCVVNQQDLGMLLECYGKDVEDCDYGSAADMDDDGFIGQSDLSILLIEYDKCGFEAD